MESASLLGILSSWEVIVVGLLLMLLLPLVFTVASLKSPVRHPAAHRGGSAHRAARTPPPADGGERGEGEPPADGARSRGGPRSAPRGKAPADQDAEES